MRHFEVSGEVMAFDNEVLTHYELSDKISLLEEGLQASTSYNEMQDVIDKLSDVDRESQTYLDLKSHLTLAEATYKSSREYLDLQKFKSLKVWIPEDAIELTEEDLQEYLNPVISDEQLAINARSLRDFKISNISWRYERYGSELRLGVKTTDSITALDKYSQSLRDITLQEGFPNNIVWPELITE